MLPASTIKGKPENLLEFSNAKMGAATVATPGISFTFNDRQKSFGSSNARDKLKILPPQRSRLIMKNLLLLFAFLLLAGCKFKTPLTEKPTHPVDPAFLGSWFSLADGKPLEIYRLSNEEYLALDEGIPYVCTHSDLEGVHFVSCKQLKNAKDVYGKFAYVAYKLEKDELLIMSLSDSLFLKEDMTPAEIRQVIGKAANNGSALDTNPAHIRRYRKASTGGAP